MAQTQPVGRAARRASDPHDRPAALSDGRAADGICRQGNLFHQEIPDYTVEDVSATVFGFPSGASGVVYATNGAIPNQWTNDYQLVAKNLTADFRDANHALFTYTQKTGLPSETIVRSGFLPG